LIEKKEEKGTIEISTDCVGFMGKEGVNVLKGRS